MQNNATTIPWFLDNMPDSYFRQIPEQMRTQHLIAVSAIKTLAQGNNLNLKISSPTIDGKTEITVMNTEAKSKILLEQMSELPVPENSDLSRVKVFQSLDAQLGLNIYTFTDHRKGLKTK